MSETVRLAELPETPTGWKKSQALHLNFGGGKGAASYDIFDEQGRKVEGISYGYNTAEKVRGFLLHADPAARYLTWAELRTAYAKAQNSQPEAP